MVTNDNCDNNFFNYLGQVACDISCKQHKTLNEWKSQQIQVHNLTPLYTYCHMQLFWSLLRANDVLPHVSIFNYLKLLFLLFLKIWHSIHMLGWFILWHVA